MSDRPVLTIDATRASSADEAAKAEAKVEAKARARARGDVMSLYEDDILLRDWPWTTVAERYGACVGAAHMARARRKKGSKAVYLLVGRTMARELESRGS
jgi:hypothetical protein